MSRFTRHFAPFALLLLVGCATVPGESGMSGAIDPVTGRTASASEDGVDDARRIGAAAYRERITLAPETLPGVSEVIVGDAYVAASGRHCRRLLEPTGARLERVACGTGERWRIVRSLSPREQERSAPPTASVVPVPE